ncbi:hypothetical protein [Amycolatopsis granulosa]|uniref:hypothetical protein n=1 Tax=Amycolatopsis granulosa TaxID=185684 RepID=UPI00141E8A2F|nr:hypothetical protein [Amycolatopsis granulosa]NIH87340.1 hypothetical protein [Amycolatopsis granulosa]
MELSLDRAQLPVPVTQDLGLLMEAADAAAEAQNASMTMKYTDWGDPVGVAAPPADQLGVLKSGR